MLKVFDELFDIQFYNQVLQFISSNNKASRNTLFYLEKVPVIDNVYPLKYLGEILERYEEHVGDDLRYLRALALALAEAKDKIEDNMYYGSQYAEFIKKVKKFAKDDMYLTCCQYLLEDEYDKKEKIKKSIQNYECTKIEEIIYLLYIFQDEMWDFQKFKLNDIIRSHEMDTYESIPIYQWVLENFGYKIKSARGKGYEALKTLQSLRTTNIKTGDKSWTFLMDCGFSKNEIIFMNYRLSQHKKHSITDERLAFQTCRALIQSSEYHICIGELITEIIEEYYKYHVCLEGFSGIVNHIDEYFIVLESVEIYKILYSQKDEYYLPSSWFVVNLLDTKWDGLNNWMLKQQYLEIFDDSLLVYGTSTPALWYKKYKQLTQTEYRDTFCEFKQCRMAPFKLLVSSQELRIEKILEESYSDLSLLKEEEWKSKWEDLNEYIERYVQKFEDIRSYNYLVKYDKLFGHMKFLEYLDKSDFIYDAFGINMRYHYRTEKMHIGKSFLNRIEHKKVLNWIIDYIFHYYPEQFHETLLKLAQDECFASSLEDNECRGIVNMILEYGKPNNSKKYILLTKYFSEEEVQREQQKDNLIIQQKEIEDMEKKRNEIQNTFNQIIMANEKSILMRIVKFTEEMYSYHNCNYFGYIFKLVYDHIINYQEKIIGTKEEITTFINCSMQFWKGSAYSLQDVQHILNKLEVQNGK